jgi:hypothetical protein
MLEIDTSKIRYVTNEALNQYADEMLHDYNPELLKSPCPIDIDDFLEFYLSLEVEHQRLSRSELILGMTVLTTELFRYSMNIQVVLNFCMCVQELY